MSAMSSQGSASRASMPARVDPYVPVLLDRRGELQALGTLEESVWRQVLPLIQIVPPDLRTPADRARPPSDWIRRLRVAVGDHPILLDIAGVRQRRASATLVGGETVNAVFEAAVTAGIQAVPVHSV